MIMSSKTKFDVIEQTAIQIISSATKHDNDGKYSLALACYQEGIQLLLEVIKGSTDKKRLEHIRQKAAEYMTRAEKIKEIVQKQKETFVFHEQIHIPENGKGFGYERVFKKYLDDSVTKVEVEDPYIRTTHQTFNFLKFCELLVRFCPKLSQIILITGRNDHEEANQAERFRNISESLSEYNIKLIVQFSPTLHDREIRFDSGWFVKIGRGLDYFKPVKKFYIGTHELDLRRCHETMIDIYKKGR